MLSPVSRLAHLRDGDGCVRLTSRREINFDSISTRVSRFTCTLRDESVSLKQRVGVRQDGPGRWPCEWHSPWTEGPGNPGRGAVAPSGPFHFLRSIVYTVPGGFKGVP